MLNISKPIQVLVTTEKSNKKNKRAKNKAPASFMRDKLMHLCDIPATLPKVRLGKIQSQSSTYK